MTNAQADADFVRRNVAETLAVSAGYLETIARVAELIVPRVAQLCLIDIDENGSLTRRAALAAPELGWVQTKLEAPHPDIGEGAPAVLRSGRPLAYGPGWFDALGRVDPALTAFTGRTLHAVTVLPLTFDNRPIGVLTLGHSGPIGTSDQTLAEDIARIAAVAITNARLLEDARAARDLAEAARARLGFVSRAGAVLARSFDRDATLRRLLATTAGDLADGAHAVIVNEDGTLDHFSAGTDLEEALEPLALRAMRDARTRVNASNHRLAVPLLTAGRVGGALSLARDVSRQPFAIDDLTMIEEVAARVAMFVEAARTYAHQLNVAETLQRAFRPRELPTVPGLVFAAAYQPGTADVDVGGDWYDVIVLDADRVAFAFGDVMGHGVEAAAAMAEVRSGLRAHLYAQTAPGRCLGYVDTLLTYSSTERDMFATGVTALYDRASRIFTIANAGHPSPYLRRANGDLTMLVAPAPLLGLDAGARAEQTHHLVSGDTVIFYTDGVVEDRALTYEAGLAALEAAIATTNEPAEMVERIMALSLASSDDRTLLAFRVA